MMRMVEINFNNIRIKNTIEKVRFTKVSLIGSYCIFTEIVRKV